MDRSEVFVVIRTESVVFGSMRWCISGGETRPLKSFFLCCLCNLATV